MMPTAPSFCIFEFYGVAVYVSTAPLAKLESFHNQFGCMAHFRLVVWRISIWLFGCTKSLQPANSKLPDEPQPLPHALTCQAEHRGLLLRISKFKIQP